jgi:SAM-dependent methyltransferase
LRKKKKRKGTVRVNSAGKHQPSIVHAAHRCWTDIAYREGRIAATRIIFADLWDFVRNSTPSRLRQLYGDADYDWDHRVNTTSAAVGWRDRLLGIFHSPYQPTEPGLFTEMIERTVEQARVDLSEFTFLDLGSGKGRTLLMASDYPFRRIVGVELLPSLDEIARENLRQYKSESQRCFAFESICADATDFPLPSEPLFMYLFNPFPESILRQVIANLEKSIREHPRPVYVLYHNPLLEHVVSEGGSLHKIAGTHQYSIFAVEQESGRRSIGRD